MSKKSSHIARLIEECKGQGWDPHYLGYFACFNCGLFFEAHDVLEELWLADRHGPNYAFHKGLIQLAGAFVHLQKDRLRPAVALFDLASANLAQYPELHEGVRIRSLLDLISAWRASVTDENFANNPLKKLPPPQIDAPQQG